MNRERLTCPPFIYIVTTSKRRLPCADPESFVRGGRTLAKFFFTSMKEERIQIPLKMAFPWRADDDQTLKAGLA